MMLSQEVMSGIDVAGEGFVAGRVVAWVYICMVVIRDAKNNIWSGWVCYYSRRVLGRYVGAFRLVLCLRDVASEWLIANGRGGGWGCWSGYVEGY
jgi:hypothetical protein